MRLYSQLTREERHVIQKMFYSKAPKKDISNYLGRDRSTIYRETRRNRTKGYNHREADDCARVRRNRHKAKLDVNGVLRLIICFLLMEKNSPEVIAFYLKDTFPDDRSMHLSHEAIYQWLYRQRGVEGNAMLSHYLFTRRRKRQNRAHVYEKRALIHGKRTIRERPVAAQEKSEAGHLEGDLIVSAGNDAYMLTLVDRKLAHTWGVSVPSKDAELVSRAVVEVLSALPDGFVKTITFDNGTEFSSFKNIESALNCNVFFADPYCAWQRGLNEHINGRIRHYIPKALSFAHLTDEDVNDILYSINNRPRKSLGWCSPSMLLEQAICCT